MIAIDLARPGPRRLAGDHARGAATRCSRSAWSAASCSPSYLKDAHSRRSQVFDLDGRLVREVELPGIGTVGGLRRQAQRPARRSTPFTSFATPGDHLPLRRRRPARARSSAAPKVRFDPDDYETGAGLLPEQGRHAGADVPRPQEGPEAGRAEPDLPLRLRRVQHLADAALSIAADWCGWRWAASTP